MSIPLVSICIPTFNGEQFIVEAMESAITQTYSNLEIVVSDDASIDATLQLIEQFKEKTKIPIYIYHHQPSGIGANWNNCIKYAKGTYIKFLFQDDVLQPTCIEEMVVFAETNKVDFVYCKRDFIYEKEDLFISIWIRNFENLHDKWKKVNVKNGVVKGKDCLKDEYFMLSPENKFGEPTAVLLNKRIFEKIGYFDMNLKQALDIEFWWRVLCYFDTGFIDKSLIYFRLHNKQASQINHYNQESEMDILWKFCYDKMFWKIHYKTKWLLLKKYNPLVNFISNSTFFNFLYYIQTNYKKPEKILKKVINKFKKK
ncbi:MAG: glycosyltransferase family 2 protein [Flavobacteriaceae bacterium]|nr:glycosyltransferase family 2 protein [Flavobacteriaceae bacterium]